VDLNTEIEKVQTQAEQPKGLAILYKQHWHVEFTHFPASFFLGSALFMVLHFISHDNRSAYELAAYVLLVFGMVVMWPTALTGWYTWKGHYHGAHARLFLYKIRTAIGVVVLSVFLVIWRAVQPPNAVWFSIYFVGIILLFAGTVVEGYFGGRLNHH
jgi:hypothetical protein